MPEDTINLVEDIKILCTLVKDIRIDYYDRLVNRDADVDGKKVPMYNLFVLLVCIADLVMYEIFLFFAQKQKRKRKKEQDQIKTFSHGLTLQQILATVAASDRHCKTQTATKIFSALPKPPLGMS